jgi:hypothetical protein
MRLHCSDTLHVLPPASGRWRGGGQQQLAHPAAIPSPEVTSDAPCASAGAPASPPLDPPLPQAATATATIIARTAASAGRLTTFWKDMIGTGHPIIPHGSEEVSYNLRPTQRISGDVLVIKRRP